MYKLGLFTLLVLLITGCKDIFVTSAFESFAKSAEDMTEEELEEYLETTPLDNISEEELVSIEETLEESFEVLTEEELTDPEVAAAYAEESVQLLEINMEQADVEGLIIDLATTDESEGGVEEVFESLVEDEERLEDLEAAADYAVEAFKADQDSLSDTQLIIGAAGLVSDLVTDDTKDLDITDIDTESIDETLYTEEEIEKIEQAQDMIDLVDPSILEQFGWTT